MQIEVPADEFREMQPRKFDDLMTPSPSDGPDQGRTCKRGRLRTRFEARRTRISATNIVAA